MAEATKQYEKTKQKDGRYPNRKQEDVQVQGPERVQRARKAGPHGKSTNADGSSFVTPLKQKKTSGGNGK
jgi:hypothetical protein